MSRSIGYQFNEFQLLSVFNQRISASQYVQFNKFLLLSLFNSTNFYFSVCSIQRISTSLCVQFNEFLLLIVFKPNEFLLLSVFNSMNFCFSTFLNSIVKQKKSPSPRVPCFPQSCHSMVSVRLVTFLS